jgi:glucan phosphoethanolaminetransferase (alkaline phosphatase superfamily)
MNVAEPQLNCNLVPGRSARGVYCFLAPRAYSALMFAALFCVLAAKFFQACKTGRVADYFHWVLSDVSVLLFAEIVLALACFTWRSKWVLRVATIAAAVACTWSVIYAGYLIRMGTEVLPRVLLPLVRDPVNAVLMIGANLIKAPVASVLLLGPSLIALGFLFCVLARPVLRAYDRRRFCIRIGVCLAIAVAAIFLRAFGGGAAYARSPHVRAVMSLFHPRLEESRRRIPYLDQVLLPMRGDPVKHNLVIVVLEGVQYAYTSLADMENGLTPHLSSLAVQGAQFTNARSSVTHTTKALFAMLTGRFPSASEDLAEAVPAVRQYAGLATILHTQLGYRTAFFQSAKGDFESRPGLVYNLGFEKFWARDDLNDPNRYIAYLACDEFAMLEPIGEWIRQDEQPFLLVVLCSVTHDPYDVPRWYGELAKEPVERYRQTIQYTDSFLRELDAKLTGLGLADNTIFCVVGDHGEAFGEHGLSGHDQIAYEEALRVPFCLRAPSLVAAGTKVAQPVSSIDLTPTLLGLLGFETAGTGFDGINALGVIPQGRRVYFCGWVREGPSGFVIGDSKYVYDPADKNVCLYDLLADTGELVRIGLPATRAQQIGDSIVSWRKSTVFRLSRREPGRETPFRRWEVRWTNRLFLSTRYLGETEN